MNIWQQFRRLNVWKKLGAIGSVCSILAFAGWLLFPRSDTSVDVKIINVPPSLERKLTMKPVYVNKRQDGKYVSLLHGKLEAPYPIPYLRVEAHGKTVENVELSPMRGGVHMGSNGKGEGYVFCELQNAIGKLKLKVVTRELEKIELRFSTEE